MSRQYRQLHSAEVPAEIDRLVLRQAEAAVQSRSSKGRPAWLRWTAPLAVAASAVLALSIVIQTGLRDETVTAVSAQKVPQPTMQAERERVESKKVEEAIVSEPVAPLSAAQESVSPTFAPADPPPPPPVQVDDRATESAANSSSRPEPRAAIQSRRPAPPPVAAPAPAMPAASGQSIARSADIATRELQSMAVESSRKQAVAHSAQQQSTAIAVDVARERREEERSADAQAYSRPINAEMPAAARAYSDPEAWLKDIRELRKANKLEEANREWRRFRVAFPNYEVAETDIAREPKK